VIILNHASSLPGYKVATTGKVLYESRPNVWRDFRLLAIKKHADSRDRLSQFKKSVIEIR